MPRLTQPTGLTGKDLLHWMLSDNATTGTPQGCRIWRGISNAKGRPIAYYMGKLRPAYRIAYFLHHGIKTDDAFMPGAVIDSHCQDKRCINPEHHSMKARGDNRRWQDRAKHPAQPPQRLL